MNLKQQLIEEWQAVCDQPGDIFPRLRAGFYAQTYGDESLQQLLEDEFYHEKRLIAMHNLRGHWNVARGWLEATIAPIQHGEELYALHHTVDAGLKFIAIARISTLHRVTAPGTIAPCCAIGDWSDRPNMTDFYISDQVKTYNFN